ncbi:MAG: serine/threonine-protein kinase [Planctomycetota bacterium]
MGANREQGVLMRPAYTAGLFRCVGLTVAAAACLAAGPALGRWLAARVFDPAALAAGHTLRGIPWGVVLAAPFLLMLLYTLLRQRMDRYAAGADGLRLVKGCLVRRERFLPWSGLRRVTFRQHLVEVPGGTGTLLLVDTDGRVTAVPGVAGIEALTARIRAALPPAVPAATPVTRMGPGAPVRSAAPTPAWPAAAPAPAAPDDGITRIGKYEVIRELGRGGFGRVLMVRDPQLDRVTAMKVLIAGEDAGTDAIARFMREGQAVARLHHPGIVGVHELGSEGAKYYMIMDFIPGRTLADLLAAGPLSPLQAAGIIRDMARALAYAHGEGIIHRDLKPANIMVAQDGAARLMDFGLARDLQGGGRLTRDGQVVGTPVYMNPEQARGDINLVDGRSDIYSLGAVFFEALIGQPPVSDDNPACAFRQILEGRPPRPGKVKPGVPRAIEKICLRAMAFKPADRYQVAGELAAALDAYITRVTHGPPWWRTRWGCLLLAGGAAAVVIGLDRGLGLPIFKAPAGSFR